MKKLYIQQSILNLVIIITLSVFIISCSKSSSDTNPDLPTKADAIVSITAFSPIKALPNSVVTITGTNFNTLVTNNTVTFNGTAAKINSVKSTEIVVTVPANATTGKIELSSNGKKANSTEDFTITTATMTDFASLGVIDLNQIMFDFAGQMFGENGSNIYKIGTSGQVDFRVRITSNIFRGIAADKAGNLYVAPGGNVTKISPENNITILAGQSISTGGLADGTGSAARFSGSSYGIANDADGNIYYGDVASMRKITPAGVVTTIAGNLKPENGYVDGKGAEAKFGVITRFTVDQTTGEVYLVDSDHYCIRKITQEGVVSTVIGSTIYGLNDGDGKNARISAPQSLAADGKGNIFFSDVDFVGSIYKIRMINKLGQVSTLITGTSSGLVNGPLGTATTNRPYGIAFDPSGNLYIVNSGAHKISKVTFQ